MTWTKIGSDTGGTNGFGSWSNTAIGDLRICGVENFSNKTVTATALSGGGCNWTLIGTKLGVTNNYTVSLFLGTISATGTQTASVTWSGTAPASWAYGSQMFHSTVGSWVVDKQGSLDSAGTNAWASLTPAASGALYWGLCVDSGSCVQGSTSGYIYNQSLDTANNGGAYNLNCAGGTATNPVWGDSGQALGMMILLAEGSSGPAVTPVGTPSQSASTGTGSPKTQAGTWGTGQTRTAGNKLIALVTAAGTTSAGAITENSALGWTKEQEGGGTFVKAAIFSKTASGSDTAPTFQSTIAGTSARSRMSVVLYELTQGSGTPAVDTGGTAAGTSASPLTVTTAGNIAGAGEFALAVQCILGTTSAANTWGASGSWSNDFSDAVTAYNHSVDASQANPASGAALSYAPTHSYTTTGTAGAVLVIKPSAVVIGASGGPTFKHMRFTGTGAGKNHCQRRVNI